MKDIVFNIHKLGPVENVEVKFAPMVILTGESSLGKSYVNYLFYYFMSFFYRNKIEELLPSPIDVSQGAQTFVIQKVKLERMLHEGLESFMQNFLGDDSFTCDVEFVISDLPKEMSYSYQYTTYESLKNNEFSFKFCDGIVQKWKQESIDEVTIAIGLSSSLVRVLFGKSLSSPIILPPGRGAFVGENFSVKNRISSSMGMYNDFFSQYDVATLPSGNGQETDEKIARLMQELIGGQLKTDKNRQYFVMEDGKQISLSAAASSIKEISPFLFYLKNKFNNFCSICFEEPEAHLHPSMQVAVADLVAAYKNKGAFFQITTHSDYFLARINQLIKLQEQEDQKEELAKEMSVPVIAALDKKEVVAYYFYRNDKGKVEVRKLEVSVHGVPFATFYDVVNELQEQNDVLDAMLSKVK